jgi:hypothetical protein
MNAGIDTPTLANVNVEQQEAELSQEIAPTVAEAKTFAVVKTPQAYMGAATFLKAIKAAKVRVGEVFDDAIDKAHATHKALTTMRRKFLDPLDAAEKTVKGGMAAFTEEQERIAEAERRRLQAIEDEKVRKAQAEQERLARIQREKEEAARRAEEQARAAAAAEQDAAKRKELEREAERKRKEAEAAAAKAAQREEQAANVAPATVIQVQTAKPEIKGIATKKVCKVAGIDMTAMGIPVAVQGFIEVKTGAL